MTDYGSNHADLTYTSLADLIEGIGNGLDDIAHDAQGFVDELVHQAAVQLLNAMLPAIVHGRNAVTRSTRWVAAEAGTLELQFNLAGAGVSTTVLAGQVAEKVELGLNRITSDLDFTDGVNSIA
ncbi:hypothetical protein GCM10027406_16000 [Leifsonia lichenia]